MRVIKEPEIQIACTRCKALLGITRSDLEVVETPSLMYSTKYSTKLPCPECGENVIFGKLELPNWITRHLKG